MSPESTTPLSSTRSTSSSSVISCWSPTSSTSCRLVDEVVRGPRPGELVPDAVTLVPPAELLDDRLELCLVPAPDEVGAIQEHLAVEAADLRSLDRIRARLDGCPRDRRVALGRKLLASSGRLARSYPFELPREQVAAAAGAVRELRFETA